MKTGNDLSTALLLKQFDGIRNDCFLFSRPLLINVNIYSTSSISLLVTLLLALYYLNIVCWLHYRFAPCNAVYVEVTSIASTMMKYTKKLDYEEKDGKRKKRCLIILRKYLFVRIIKHTFESTIHEHNCLLVSLEFF